MDSIIKYEFHVKIEGLISKIASRFIRVNDEKIETVMMKTLAEIGEVLNADRVYIFEFDAFDKVMNNTYEWCKIKALSEKDNLQGLPFDVFPWWINKILNNEMIYIENTKEMPEEALEEKKLLLAQGINSLIVLPIIVENKSVGFFGVDNVIRTDIWNDNNNALLKIISNIFSDFFAELDYKKKLIKKNEYLNESFEQLKKLQLEIIQKEKMSAIGQLSSGLAHEINNTFASIKSNIELLDEYYDLTIKDILLEYAKRSDEKKDVEFLIKEISPIFDDINYNFDKVETIINSIRRLTDASNSLFEKYSINDLIKEVLWIYKSTSHDELELLLDLNQVNMVYCIRSEIQDAVNLILKNSIEAFRKKGIKKPKLEIRTYEKDGYIVIKIIDNAGGIEKEIIDKVFEPFFTTKSIGEAYGLGLSQVYDIIVNRHKGKIKLRNEVDKRLCMTIRLPNIETYEKIQ